VILDFGFSTCEKKGKATKYLGIDLNLGKARVAGAEFLVDRAAVLHSARARIFHKVGYAPFLCKRNVEMTPLCKIEVTLARVLGSREVRRGGGVVDEQAGVQPS
jgi:hypothetical protein